MRSVPGAVATGSVLIRVSRLPDDNPVATAPGTDLMKLTSTNQSSPHPSSVNDEHVSVHIVTRRGSKEDGSTREIRRLAPTTSRNAFEYLSIAGLVLLQCLCVVRAHMTRRDRVDFDSVPRPLIS